MPRKQTVEQALAIAAHCAKALEIAGHWADVPYSQAQLCEVIATLKEVVDDAAAQIATANRQVAAANARVARASKV